MARARRVPVAVLFALCALLGPASAKLGPRFHKPLYGDAGIGNGLALAGAARAGAFALSNKGPAPFPPAQDWAPGICTGETAQAAQGPACGAAAADRGVRPKGVTAAAAARPAGAPGGPRCALRIQRLPPPAPAPGPCLSHTQATLFACPP
jgi:hypothetical protein